MKIIFIRHALAEELGHGKPGLDELRRIVKPGATQTRHLALALGLLRLRPDILLTSPLVRARETADVIVENMKRCPEPLETDALAPEASWAETAASTSFGVIPGARALPVRIGRVRAAGG